MRAGLERSGAGPPPGATQAVGCPTPLLHERLQCASGAASLEQWSHLSTVFYKHLTRRRSVAPSAMPAWGPAPKTAPLRGPDESSATRTRASVSRATAR